MLQTSGRAQDNFADFELKRGLVILIVVNSDLDSCLWDWDSLLLIAVN